MVIARTRLAEECKETLPWRGRVGSHTAKRNAKRGGVTVSPPMHCQTWRDRHPTSPRASRASILPLQAGESHMALERYCKAVGTGFLGFLSIEGDLNAQVQALASTAQGSTCWQYSTRSAGDRDHCVGGHAGRRQDLHRVRVLWPRPSGAVAAVPGAQTRDPQP